MWEVLDEDVRDSIRRTVGQYHNEQLKFEILTEEQEIPMSVNGVQPAVPIQPQPVNLHEYFPYQPSVPTSISGLDHWTVSNLTSLDFSTHQLPSRFPTSLIVGCRTPHPGLPLSHIPPPSLVDNIDCDSIIRTAIPSPHGRTSRNHQISSPHCDQLNHHANPPTPLHPPRTRHLDLSGFSPTPPTQPTRNCPASSSNHPPGTPPRS